MQLKQMRGKIDKIDKRIVELLNQRAQEVIKISLLKKKKKLSLYSPEREASMLESLKKLSQGPLRGEDIENVFREVLSACRSQKANLEIAYLGPQGTFTHLAAIKKFGKRPDYLPVASISDVFDAVDRDQAQYGVVPVENSTEGVINYTLDMFFGSSLNICAEITMNISHALLAKGSESIKRVYSNPEVFAQCRNWIAASLKDVELVPVSSTAKAAKEAKKDKNGACIGNKILANLYGLRIIASSIQDSSNNYTRFLVIAKNDSPPSGKDKTSILFSTKDKVGALHDILSSFKASGLNLTKIESRPSKKKAWEYYFFVDFQGHKSSALVKKSLKKLEKQCSFVKLLGSYPCEN
ncbi:MAG: prephenate dehydratase [Candidatus Omnitrophica bacterium]|nr:prephenate dehydratase [Candidatus Omnitrophota bacterium]